MTKPPGRRIWRRECRHGWVVPMAVRLPWGAVDVHGSRRDTWGSTGVGSRSHPLRLYLISLDFLDPAVCCPGTIAPLRLGRIGSFAMSLRVLIVDDEVEFTEMVKLVLDQIGG